jgi:hypothetical protein
MLMAEADWGDIGDLAILLSCGAISSCKPSETAKVGENSRASVKDSRGYG